MDPKPTTPKRNQANLIDAALRQVAAVDSDHHSTIATGNMQRAVARMGVHLPAEIPGYELLDEIHRGGQGVVFRARQEATDRVVAIKLMREGPLATADEWGRFEREVRILAQLKHPNIVSIYHSDVTENFYYYVMDYIDGEALDTWSQRSTRTVAELVEAFARVCDAVAAAHLRGVIHRDLKPSNVRVDRHGQPHVLDFGLSKLVDADEDASSMTLTGQFVGSVPWASPEQAEGHAAALDIRTDVYSLGVLFYQMLTARFPYDVMGSRHDVLRRICESEPARPRSVRPNVPVDIETIVLKCLQKDPARRYQSAGELARDVRRYQANEPIEARRDSLSYMLRKQIARHRVPATIAASFLLLVVAGLFVSIAFWRQAVVAQASAEHQKRIAEQQADAARDQSLLAKAEAAKAEATAEFLESILTTADPRSELGPDTTALELLKSAVEVLDDGAVQDQPEVAERIRRTLARAFQGLGSYDEADEQFKAAASLHTESTDLLTRSEALRQHAAVLSAKSDYQAALAHLEEAWTVLESDSDLLKTDVAAAVMSGMGAELRSLGRPEESVDWLRRSIALWEELGNPDALALLRPQTNLGLLLKDRGEFEESLQLLATVVASGRELYSDAHPDFGIALNNLADLYRVMGRYEDAIPIQREALDVLRRNLPGDHPHIGFMLNNLGQSYQELDRLEEAEVLFVDALRIVRMNLDENHATVAIMINNIGLLRQEQGKLEEAEASFTEALQKLKAAHGPRHQHVGLAMYNLARVYATQEQFEKAEEIMFDAYDIFVEMQGPGHPRTIRCGLLYANIMAGLEDYEPATELLRELLKNSDKAYPESVAALHLGLGATLTKQGLYEEAEAELLTSYEQVGTTRAKDKVVEVRKALHELYIAWERPDEAAKWLPTDETAE